MRRLRLIHWNAAEASGRAGILRALGYRVDASPFSPAELRKLKTYPADAFLIDLSRLPSQGRDVALFIRQVKATRHIPLVLIEGDREKVAGIRRILPDAIYAMWSEIRGPLTRVLSRPPKAPVVPGVFAGYAGAGMAKKLGIKPRSVVVLVGAPAGFERSLGPLPPGAAVHRGARRPGDLTLWFVRSQRELERQIRAMKSRAASAGLWIL